ncbi:MAG: type 1 glutamine amidotransferase domain-containing protein [Kofleriaceae bacterium]|nr:type 1 glutamine amidotransferase domain-containing protein [Kofleriaceae bacterium]
MAANRMLIVVTNVGEYEKVGYRTGLWLGELTHFWDVGEAAGIEMDIASPGGGYVPIDPDSLMLQELGHAIGIDGKVHQRYADRRFMERLSCTSSVEEIDPERYDAIYLTGGHGVCFDFPKSTGLAALIAQFYESGRIVSAVCHGPAGLLEAKLASGEYLIRGKAVTGYSWREEVLARRADAVPFSLEQELQKRGASYSKAAFPFARNVVVDGRLITGQNPASADGVGKAVVKQLLESRGAVRDELGARRARQEAPPAT